MSTPTSCPKIPRLRRRLFITGVVQGVGFRPYVYRLAIKRNLAGFVRNTSSGVEIEIEGDPSAIDSFANALPGQGPPSMRIAAIQQMDLSPVDEKSFVILESEAGQNSFTLVPPDISVCDACLAETRDPGNRRFEYPFTNCTNCGPRYSIIVEIPYERSQTTMSEFLMCDACRREYEDPAGRRFHAQPNACPACGPHLWMTIPGDKTENNNANKETARQVLETVARILLAGGIVAWKGLGGYQLACDARNGLAVSELRRRKRRSEKPFAVMVRGVSVAIQSCFVNNEERAVLLSPERPIVLLARRPNAEIASEVSFGHSTIGVMLPCTPMHELLLRILAELNNGDVPLVMTGGNIGEEPIAVEDKEAMRTLSGVADAFASHNRRIHSRMDDSVVRILQGQSMLLRRARGYAPRPIRIGRGDAEVLGCGARAKNTLCLTRAGYALPSQHLGDLDNDETLRFFEETLDRMKRLFHVEPRTVAYDLNPAYLSTQFAMKMQAERRIGVQHHHAHIAACMADHALEGPVIGVAWDGKGYGPDGTIWGGEFLVADLGGFERVAHLRPILLPGGDPAVHEPWRVARAYLYDAYDADIPKTLSWGESIPEESVRTLDEMLRKRTQFVKTSSCGRLFEAVASLVGLHHTVSFDGQAAMALEAVAAQDEREPYPMVLDQTASEPIRVDAREMIWQIVEDIGHNVSAAMISARFHQALIQAIIQVCRIIRAERALNRVCLSGDCFQNMRLLRGSVDGLKAEGFNVYFSQRIPANDGGISLGQAVIACELVQRGNQQSIW